MAGARPIRTGVEAASEDVADLVPLTEAQEGLWYAQRLDPLNPLFNTGQYVELLGPLDREAFRAAVDRAVGEADALALRIEDGAGGPRQRIDEAVRPSLEIVDLSAEPDPQEAAQGLIECDIAAAPDLSAMAAERLFVLGPDRHLWYQRLHHLVADGYGTALLNRRIAELYNHGDGEAGPPLGALRPVLEEDAAYRRSEKRGADATFWRDYLAALPEAGGMAPGRAVSAHRFDRAVAHFPPPFLQRLQARAAAAGLTWPDLVTALVAAYCRRFAGTPEIVVGVPHMARLGSAAARVPAMVMNVLPLRVTAPDEMPVADFLSGVARDLSRARRHGRYRSEQVRRDLGLLGGHRRLYGPLINVLPFDVPPVFPGLSASAHVLSTGPVDDITLTFRGDGRTSLHLEVDTNPNLYTHDEGSAHAARLVRFLDRALDAATLGDIPLATEAEAHRHVFELNRTTRDIPDTTLSALIEERFRAAAADVALVAGADSWSYDQLERETRALSQALRLRGVERRHRGGRDPALR